MISYLIHAGAAFLVIMGLVLSVRPSPRPAVFLAAVPCAGLLGFVAVNADPWVSKVIESSLALGLFLPLLVTLLALLTKIRRSVKGSTHQWMFSLAIAGWLIAHSAFFLIETQGLRPAWKVQQAHASAWVLKSPESIQHTFCSKGGMACAYDRTGVLVWVRPDPVVEAEVIDNRIERLSLYATAF